MAQLVGSSCVLCRDRIADILEGEFCSQCGNPVHRRCARRDSGSLGVCALCGSDPTAAAEIRKLEEEQRRVVVPYGPLPGDDIIRTVRTFRWGYFLFGGIVIMMIGICLGVAPEFRSDPRQFSIEDLLPAIAACVVGGVMVLLAVVGMKQK